MRANARMNTPWARFSVFAATLAIVLSLAPPSRAADTYPDHKIRVIVPFAAGGPTDVIARLASERLSEAWGQQLYVENMPGAGGNLGVEIGGRAAPDGYTIVVVSTGFIINPSMYSKIGYDPVKDFAPISLVAASPNVVTVHPSVPAKDLKELIALIKANPGKFSFAQPATGSTPHLAGEFIQAKLRSRSRHRAVQCRAACDQFRARQSHADFIHCVATGDWQHQGRYSTRHCNSGETARGRPSRIADQWRRRRAGA